MYSVVEASIDAADVIKGIAFWRWDAAQSPDASLAAFDSFATICKLTFPSFPISGLIPVLLDVWSI